MTRRPDCPTCVERNFEYLEGERGRLETASLCGRNAVQINPGRGHALVLTAVADRLRPLGEVTANEYLVKFSSGNHELTIFPDGRAIVKGTDDPAVARTLYSRYVGI